MKKNILCLLLCLLGSTLLQAQNQTVFGTITSRKNGEKLIGATIYDTINKIGAVTNEYGFYSLTIPKGNTVFEVKAFGFVSQLVAISTDTGETNLKLTEEMELQEVKIKASDGKRNVESTNLGSLELPLEKVNKLPVLFGERDVLKTLQLMPGVKSGGEGTSGIYVRGGGPDQNLILLDGVPVYNVSHLFGFVSVFNNDALSNVTLMKGAFPGRYGGRASSVLDMRMKEGNNQSFNAEGAIGLIMSRLLIEGPIKKDKTAFIISARRSYIDLLTRPIFAIASKGFFNAGYYFHDFNAKINHKINDKNHLYLSGYFGDDVAFFNITQKAKDEDFSSSFKIKTRLQWGNAIGAIRWNHRINPKFFVNTTGSFSHYKYQVGVGTTIESTAFGHSSSESSSSNYFSGIYDFGFKSDFTYIPASNSTIRFGVGNIYHTFTPGITVAKASNSSEKTEIQVGSPRVYAHETTVYAENDHKLTTRLKINYGFHFSTFFVQNTIYPQFQPRISGNFRLNEVSSIKLGYSKMAQFLHLLSNNGVSLPTDLWLPVTNRIKPITSHQVGAGYNRELGKMYGLTVEAYYKNMGNLIQYKEGADFQSQSDDWQDQVQIGKGWSYGLEVLLEKRVGKFSGWIGYTLSWTNRQFESLNNGLPFPDRYDRRHDASFVLTFKKSEKWDFGLVWVYGTGNAVNLESQNYAPVNTDILHQYANYGANTIPYYSSYNSYRMPAYHRLDLSANRTRNKKWGKSVLSFSVYNVYNRINPFMMAPVTVEKDGKSVNKMYKYGLFPVIPSISWQFKFDFKKIAENRTNRKLTN